MRELTTHLADQEPSVLKVEAADESGVGSPCHRYEVSGFYPQGPFQAIDGTQVDQFGRGKTTIIFQQGPIHPVLGQNGITVQALLAAISARLSSSDAGQTHDALSKEVLENLRMAIENLDKRDRQRLSGLVADRCAILRCL